MVGTSCLSVWVRSLYSCSFCECEEHGGLELSTQVLSWMRIEYLFDVGWLENLMFNVAALGG